MDIQRTLLIGAVAFLSVLLLKEWVATDKAQLPTAQVASTSQATAPEVPTGAPTTTAAEELPQAPGAATVSAPVENKAAASNSLISVETDLMQLKIDPVGGDVVAIALTQHQASSEDKTPFQLLENSERRVYIAQSGLVGDQGTDKDGARPTFNSNARSYSLQQGQDSLSVDLLLETPEARITKRYSFKRGDYLIKLEYLVENRSAKAWNAALYGQIKRDSSLDPSASGNKMGMQSYLGAATSTADAPYHKLKFNDIKEKAYQGQLQGGWMAMIQHYFVSAWVPDANSQNNYFARVTSQGMHLLGFTSPAVSIAPGKSGSLATQFYAGPKDQFRLAKIAPGLDLVVDYGWLWWIAQPLFVVLYFFSTGQLHLGDSVFQIGPGLGNWGLAIIFLTLVVKACFYHLSATSYRSMANMRKVTPKLMEIRERYADDRQKQSMMMMELYKKEKINPMGGCLPILVQMPVFLGLYWMLMEAIELRHAPFYGWITDLSVMDPWFVLPALMGITMFIQQKLNPQPTDPMQAKVLQWMPVIFTVFFVFFPAGLVLYWVVNSVLSIAQQWMITRAIEAGEKA